MLERIKTQGCPHSLIHSLIPVYLLTHSISVSCDLRSGCYALESFKHHSFFEEIVGRSLPGAAYLLLNTSGLYNHI